MAFNVKNTTILKVFDMVCPSSCRGCGELGSGFCACCKNNILGDKINYCPNCKKVIRNGKCEECQFPFLTFMVGWRDEEIGELVGEYKYNSARELAGVFVELLDEILPQFMEEVVVVPLPTINKHIRERGFDHTFVVAKKLAKGRKWGLERAILRKNDTVQVGASEKERKEQAKRAYRLNEKSKIDSNKVYVLFDDVWTTGASMKEAARIMKKAGAKNVVVAVLAVNRIGRKPKLDGCAGGDGFDDEINNRVR